MQFDERRYRPLRTVDLFDEAFDIYKKNFVLLLGVAALVYVPMQTLISALYLAWAQQAVNHFSGNPADTDAAFGFLGRALTISLAMSPISLVGFTLVFGALAKAVSACYLEMPITIWEAYKASFRRFFANMVALLIDSILIGLGSICLVLFIIPFIRYLVVTPVTVLEGAGPFAAMKRSSVLGRGNDWRLLSTLTVLFVLSFILYAALQGVILLCTYNTGVLFVPVIAKDQQVATQVAGGLASLLMLPFQTAVITLLYYDLRIRQEGYDMEILAERLGYPPVDYKSAAPHVAALTVGRVAAALPPKGRA